MVYIIVRRVPGNSRGLSYRDRRSLRLILFPRLHLVMQRPTGRTILHPTNYPYALCSYLTRVCVSVNSTSQLSFLIKFIISQF